MPPASRPSRTTCTRRAGAHPVDEQAWLDEPWRAACNCVMHPCIHDTRTQDDTAIKQEAGTMTSTQTVETAETGPPIFDDEPPF